MMQRSIPLGWLLIAWVAITALIALNRGIDLLWGVTILIAVAAIIAVLLPWVQLLGIGVRRAEFPAAATVGRTETIAYEIAARGWRARYGIEIFDYVDGGSNAVPTAFVPSVKGTVRQVLAWTPRVRGCWQLPGLVIASGYPLGLARATRHIATPAREIIVYPDFAPLRWLPVQDAAHPRFERTVNLRRGGRDEIFGLRPYAPGDERRTVDWRASARRGEIVVKEFERQQDRQIWILLDLAESAHTGAAPYGTCEQMIRIAHSVAVKARELQAPVGLIYSAAGAIVQVPAGADRGTYLAIRDALARVNTHAQPPLAHWARGLADQLPRGGAWVIFNLGGSAGRAALGGMARQRGALPLMVEFDEDSYTSGEPAPPARVRTQVLDGSTVSTVPRGADLSELFGFVIPAQAGIQAVHPPSGDNHGPLDSRLRGNDEGRSRSKPALST